MDLHEFLRSRRSVRRFLGPAARTGKTDPVPESVVERILTTATFAPSAHNLQPWRFVVVNGPDARNRLGRALTAKMRLDMQAEGAPEPEIEKRSASSLRRIEEAPVLILLCRDASEVRADTPEETIMAIQSVAAAGLQLLLAAHAEGLAGNWICWPLYAQEETSGSLELPEMWEPQAMIFVGHAAEIPEARERRSLEEIIIKR
jgi:F420 biosynthesis protein FbiB-like protein